MSFCGKTILMEPFPLGEFLREGGLVYGFCEQPPLCMRACTMQIIYVYPKCSLHLDISKYMSRLAVHMGWHDHGIWKGRSRSSKKKAEQIVCGVHLANHVSTLARVRTLALGNLISMLHLEASSLLSKEEDLEICESIKVVSTIEKFQAIFWSVKISNLRKGELDSLCEMQAQNNFPYLQRYLLQGKGVRLIVHMCSR